MTVGPDVSGLSHAQKDALIGSLMAQGRPCGEGRRTRGQAGPAAGDTGQFEPSAIEGTEAVTPIAIDSQAKHHHFDPRKQTPDRVRGGSCGGGQRRAERAFRCAVAGRLQIGSPAGFKSKSVAGFLFGMRGRLRRYPHATSILSTAPLRLDDREGAPRSRRSGRGRVSYRIRGRRFRDAWCCRFAGPGSATTRSAGR